MDRSRYRRSAFPAQSVSLGLAAALLWFAACDRGAVPDATQQVVASDSAAVAEVMPQRPLRFGRPPNLGRQTRAEYEPLARYLGAAIGHPIEVVVPDSYDGVVEGFANGSIDIAQVPPFTYVRIKKRMPEVVGIASLLAEGATTYRAYIVVRAGSSIKALRDLKGKCVAFVDKGSTSGYLFPVSMFIDVAMDPQRDFGEVQFAGSHLEVVQRVRDGRCDAGAISSTTFQHLREQELNQHLTIVAKSTPIPFDAVIVHPQLAVALRERLRQTLQGIDSRTSEGRAVLQGITITNAFLPFDDTLYAPVRQVADRLTPELFR